MKAHLVQLRLLARKTPAFDNFSSRELVGGVICGAAQAGEDNRDWLMGV